MVVLSFELNVASDFVFFAAQTANSYSYLSLRKAHYSLFVASPLSLLFELNGYVPFLLYIVNLAPDSKNVRVGKLPTIGD